MTENTDSPVQAEKNSDVETRASTGKKISVAFALASGLLRLALHPPPHAKSPMEYFTFYSRLVIVLILVCVVAFGPFIIISRSSFGRRIDTQPGAGVTIVKSVLGVAGAVWFLTVFAEGLKFAERLGFMIP